MLHRLVEHPLRRASRGPRPLRLVMTLLVRNEVDIIADNIRFHARQGVDAFVVMDNNSDDGTLDVLHELQHEHDLHILRQPAEDYRQAEWMTQLAFAARRRCGADLVISNDADEFYLAAPGRTLKSCLSPKDAVVQVRRYNMALDESCRKPGYHYTDASLKVVSPLLYSRQTQLESSAVSMLLVKISPKVIVNPYGLWRLKGGNHRARHFWGMLRARTEPGIEVIHYPIRSWEQFERSIVHRKRLLETSNARMGDHYRRWVALYNAGKLEAEFEKMVLDEQACHLLLDIGVLNRDERVPKLMKAGISRDPSGA